MYWNDKLSHFVTENKSAQSLNASPLIYVVTCILLFEMKTIAII